MVEFEESNIQFLRAWTTLARRAARGEVSDLGGVVAMYGNVRVPFLNVFGFDTPVRDEADLQQRVHRATCYAKDAGLPYFIAICEEMVPREMRERLDAVFSGAGLSSFMEWTGMAAEPVAAWRPAPPELEIRPVSDRQSRIAVSDLNSAAYDMQAEPAREPLSREQLWEEMFGSVGYVGGIPVATATTLPVDSRLYVAFVATHPAHRRRGYAEACMRDSLQRAAAATGLRRSVLHATDAGHPVYLKMGYYDVTKFILYAEGED